MRHSFWPILLLAGARSFGATDAPHWDVDSVAIEKHYVSDASRPSLHSRGFSPDGVKGLHWSEPIASTNSRITIPPPFANKDEYSTHTEYCVADAIVVGTLVESTPMLRSTKSSIYTLLNFSVSKIIKSDGFLGSGRTAIAYRMGGELNDAGEKLRVDFENRPPYKIGASYILELMHDKAARKRQYYFRAEDWTVELKDSAIVPNYQKWAGFPAHTPYADVVSRFQKMAKIDCDSR